MDSIRTIRECLHDLQFLDIDPDERQERYRMAHRALSEIEGHRIGYGAITANEHTGGFIAHDDEGPRVSQVGFIEPGGRLILMDREVFDRAWEWITDVETEKANPAENDGDAQPHRPDSNQTTPQV